MALCRREREVIALQALLRAFWADAEKFEFVVEVFVAGSELDFFFKLVHWARRIDRLDRATVGANEVVAVLVG